jgi:hypothetical protein
VTPLRENIIKVYCYPAACCGVVHFYCARLSLSLCTSLPSTFTHFSLDHLVRSRQHSLRDRDADLLRRLEIDHQLKLRGLLHRKMGGLGAFENLIRVCGGAAAQINKAHAAGHKPPGFHILALQVYRQQPTHYRVLLYPRVSPKPIVIGREANNTRGNFPGN